MEIKNTALLNLIFHLMIYDLFPIGFWTKLGPSDALDADATNLIMY